MAFGAIVDPEVGKVRAGQRKINLIWEVTQSVIAILVVASTLFVSSWMVIKNMPNQIPTIFSVAFGTIVGFYFARTNHSNIGGIGFKEREGPESRR